MLSVHITSMMNPCGTPHVVDVLPTHGLGDIQSMAAEELGVAAQDIELWSEAEVVPEEWGEVLVEGCIIEARPSVGFEARRRLRRLGVGWGMVDLCEEVLRSDRVAATDEEKADLTHAALTASGERRSDASEALTIACWEGYDKVAAALLESGADPDKGVNRTPLHLACKQGCLPVVKTLLQHGADPSKPSRDGWTPLHASIAGNLRIIEVLLSHGARLNSQDDIGRTPLHVATDDGNLEAVTMLLSNGALPDISETHGLTPLHIASWSGNLEVATAIISHGADLKAVTATGLAPLDFAVRSHRQAVVDLIRGSEATSRGVLPVLAPNS